MATILAHLSPFPGGLWGFAHTVPRWKMQSGPRVCFHILIAYFDLRHSPKDFSAEGWVSPCLVTGLLSLTLLGVRRMHFLHPRWCLTVSKAFLRWGQAEARWFDKLLFLFPLWFLAASYVLIAVAFPVCGLHQAVSVFRNYLHPEGSGRCCRWLEFDSWYHHLPSAPDLSECNIHAMWLLGQEYSIIQWLKLPRKQCLLGLQDLPPVPRL